MARIDLLFAELGRQPSDDAADALGEALATARPPYDARIHEILRSAGGDAANAAIAANYSTVPDNLRSRLGADAERTRAALSLALRRTSVTARIEAMKGARACGDGQIAYLLAENLRDDNLEISRAAADTLRRLAENVLRLETAPAESDRATVDAEKSELLRAIREALRTFDRHCRLAVLETALWFACELGEELWARLEDPKGKLSDALHEHLPKLRSTWLAAFYLEALSRSAWRTDAVTALQNSFGAEDLVAILRCSHRLRSPAFARGVHALRKPPWLCQQIKLTEIPERFRAELPVWVSNVGMSDGERVELLVQWQQSPDERLARASVYALAAMASGAGDAVLQQTMEAARRREPFIEWYLEGRANKAANASSNALARGGRD